MTQEQLQPGKKEAEEAALAAIGAALKVAPPEPDAQTSSTEKPSVIAKSRLSEFVDIVTSTDFVTAVVCVAVGILVIGGSNLYQYVVSYRLFIGGALLGAGVQLCLTSIIDYLKQDDFEADEMDVVAVANIGIRGRELILDEAPPYASSTIMPERR
jgi:hypothetical protein